MKTHAHALPLFSGMAVMMSLASPKGHDKKKSVDAYTLADLSPEEREEELKKRDEHLVNLKKANARERQIRQKKQKRAERLQIEKELEAMKYLAERNNSALKHIAYFTNIVEFATANNLPLAMGEHSIAIKESLMLPKWSRLKVWITKNLIPCCLVSIGRKPKGWWTIRWIVVGDSRSEDLYSLTAPFGAYLAKTGWRTKAVAMDDDPSRLRDHYLLRQDDDDETLKTFVPEMFEIYRAGLSIPRATRTHRNASAQGVLDILKMPVRNSAAYPVNGLRGYFGGASPSGVALCEIKVKKGQVVEARWIGDASEVDAEEGDETFADIPNGDF